MADMRKVVSGEALAIPAATWNAFIDSAQYTDSLRRSLKGKSPTDFLPDGIYYVKNASGQALPRHSILGIDSPLWPPRTFFDAFSQGVVLKGVKPDEDEHSNKFVVLQEPLQDGEVGRCWADGIAPVKMRTDAVITDLADVITDEFGLLQGGTSGAQMIWIDSDDDTGTGTGTGDDFKWALIRLGGGGGGLTSSFIYIPNMGTGTGGAPVLYPGDGLGGAQMRRLRDNNSAVSEYTFVSTYNLNAIIIPISAPANAPESTVQSYAVVEAKLVGNNWMAISGGTQGFIGTKASGGVTPDVGIGDAIPTSVFCGEIVADGKTVFVSCHATGALVLSTCCSTSGGTGT